MLAWQHVGHEEVHQGHYGQGHYAGRLSLGLWPRAEGTALASFRSKRGFALILRVFDFLPSPTCSAGRASFAVRDMPLEIATFALPKHEPR